MLKTGDCEDDKAYKNWDSTKQVMANDRIKEMNDVIDIDVEELGIQEYIKDIRRENKIED